MQPQTPLDKVHFRHCILYEFQLKHSAATAHRNLILVFSNDTPSERQCEYWFSRFARGDLSLEDEFRTGRPLKVNLDALQELVRSNPRLSTREMKNELGADHKTINRRLKDLGYVQKIGAWKPNQLTESQKEQRVTICSNLLLRRLSIEWLKHIVTGDEKWVLYFNQTRKRHWVLKGETPEPEVKLDMKEKKVMFSV